MARTKQPLCIENPKTGKLYMRHNYKETQTGVESYVRDSYGGYVPFTYSYTLTCNRCGFKVYGTY